MTCSSKVSVLIAARNAEKTITSAVRSCLIALRKDDEILVYLDGCTDRTREKLEKIRDKRVHYFESKVNIGRVAARNALFLKSSGQIIAILDADDISLPWRFWWTRIQLKTCDAVFGSAFLFGKLPMKIPFAPTYPFPISAEFSRLVLAYRNPFIHSTAAFWRDSVPNHPVLYQDIVAEEYDLWIRMATAKKRLAKSSVPLSCYRIHPGQISQSPNFHFLGISCGVLNANREALIAQIYYEYGVNTLEAIKRIASSNFWIGLEERISGFMSKIWR
jgi:glycosyltransferase involved in cell wall biosynthesis